MSDIPADILNKAAEHVENMPQRPPFKADMLNAIAKAIVDERDRCAKIARDFGDIELRDRSLIRGSAYASESIFMAITEHPTP